MADVIAVRSAVSDLLGRRGDETIREYIMAVLELGDYDFGRNGELAYEHFGQMLVQHSVAATHSCCILEVQSWIACADVEWHLNALCHPCLFIMLTL